MVGCYDQRSRYRPPFERSLTKKTVDALTVTILPDGTQRDTTGHNWNTTGPKGARFPAAAYLALNNQRCRISAAATRKHTRSKGRTLLGDAGTIRRGVVVTVTRNREIAPLTPNERVRDNYFGEGDLL